MVRITDCISEGPYTELRALSAFDHYFSFSGREYRVLNPLLLQDQPAFEVECVQSDQNWLLTTLKVISLFTLIVPLIMLIGKLICRSQCAFYLKGSHLKEPDPVTEAEVKKEITPDEKIKIDQAKELAQNFDKDTIGKILALGIKNQAALIEIANICANKLAWTVAENIHKFGITDQAGLIEIAKICAEKSPLNLSKNIQNFGIIDHSAFIEIAKICAAKDLWLDNGAVALHIQNFGISDQAVLIEIAKICANKSPVALSNNIKNFGITDQSALIEIAKIGAEKDPVAVAYHIQDFGITEQAGLIEIVKICAKKIPDKVVDYIQNFGITDQSELIEIAKICAEKDPKAVAKNMQNFGIKDLSVLGLDGTS